MFEQDDDPFAKYAQPQQPAPAQPAAPKSPTTGQPIGKTKLGFPLWNERQARKAREIEDAGYEITATTNGRHATNSPHYNGTGFDIRTKDLHPDSIAALKRDIAARKGARIDYEQPGANANTTNEHLHYDFTDEADDTPAPSKAQPVDNDPFAKYVQPDTPVGQTSEPQSQSLVPVAPKDEADRIKQQNEILAAKEGRTENGEYILNAGEADTTPLPTAGTPIKRNAPLMVGVAERGKLIQKGQAEASTPFQLQANRKFKPQQLETMIVGSPDKPPTQDEILNAALREVGISRADAAKIWKNRQGNPIGNVDVALQQQGGNLRYDADTGTWRHTVIVSPEAQQLVDNFRNGKAPDAVDDSQGAQLQNAISQGLEQSPNMVAGLESAASGLLKTGSNIGKLATLQSPQTAPENRLDEMSGAFGQDAEKARQYMTTAEKVRTGLLSGAITLPLINEIVVNGGLPAFVAQNLAGRAHLSKDEQLKGAITDLAMLATGNLAGGQMGNKVAGTLANAGTAGALQTLGAAGSGAAKDAGDLAENFITGAAFGLNAPHERRAGVEGIGNVRPNEPGSPQARAYADAQEAKMAQDAELLARAGQAQRAMEAQANLANNGIRPDGTEAQANIAGAPKAAAPAQPNASFNGIKAKIEEKGAALNRLNAREGKAEVPQTVEIIAPDAVPEVTAGTKLREIEIDGVTHVVRIPAKMDKETARILTRAQLRQGVANESSQTESPNPQGSVSNPANPLPESTAKSNVVAVPERGQPANEPVRGTVSQAQTSPQIKPEAGAQAVTGAAKPNLDAEIAAFDAARNEVKSNNGTQAQTLPAPVASVQGAEPSGNRENVRPFTTGEQAGSTRSTQERPQTQEQTVKPLKPINYGIDRENVISEIRKMGGIDARHARTGEFKDLAREYPALFRKGGTNPDIIANSLGLGSEAGALGTYLRDYKAGKASLEALAQRDAEHLQKGNNETNQDQLRSQQTTAAEAVPTADIASDKPDNIGSARAIDTQDARDTFRPEAKAERVDESQLSEIDLAERRYYQQRMKERADLVGDRKTDVGEHGQISNLARRAVTDESGNVLQYPMSAHPEWSKHLDITPDASHDQVLDAIAQDLGGKTRSSELSPDDWRGIMQTHGADWSNDLKQTVAHTVAAAEVKNKKWDSFLNDTAAQELLNKAIEPRGMALRTRELMKIAERYNDGNKLTNVSDSRVKELIKEIQSARASEPSQERTSEGTHVADEQRAETVTEAQKPDQSREPAQSAIASESANQRESRTAGSREKRGAQGDEPGQQSVKEQVSPAKENAKRQTDAPPPLFAEKKEVGLQPAQLTRGAKLTYNGKEMTYRGADKLGNAVLEYPDGEEITIPKTRAQKLWESQQEKAKDAPANDNTSRIAFLEKELASATEPRAHLLRKKIAELKGEPRLTKAQRKEGGFIDFTRKPKEKIALPDNFDAEAFDKEILSFINKAGDRKISAKRVAKADQFYTDAMNAIENNDGAALARAQRGLQWAMLSTNTDAVTSFIKAGLLTSAKTHLRNLGGNAAYQVFDEVASIPAAFADILVSAKTGNRAATFTLAKGSITGAKKGWQDAKELWRRGMTEEELGKFEMHGAINPDSIIGKYTNGTFKLLSAEDRIFKGMSYNRSIENQARAIALTESRADKSLNVKQRTKLLTAEPTAEMQATAIFDAEVQTFNNHNPFADGFNEIVAKRSAPVKFGVNLLVPFVKTPSNIIARTLEATPLGYAKNAYQLKKLVTDGFTPQEQRAFSQTFGRATVGSALIAIGYGLAAKGLMTGIRDDDQKEIADNAVKKADGRLDGAFKLGGKWHQLTGFAPLGGSLGIGATLHEEGKKGAVRAGIDTALDQPLLHGAKDLFALGDEKGRTRFAAGKIGMLIPSMVADVAAQGDKVDRKAEGYTGQLQKRIPYLRNKLPENKDVFGQPIERAAWPMINPFNSRTAKNDVALDEMIKLDMGAGAPRLRKGETKEQMEARQVKTGKAFREQAKSLIESAEYKAMDAAQRQAAIKKLRTRISETTR